MNESQHKPVLLNPELFSYYFLKILDKDQQLVNFEWNTLQKDFYKNRSGYDLILKSRQIGFSTLIQAIIFHSAITETTSALTLSHNQQTTDKLRLIQERFYLNFPDNIQEFHKPARKYANNTLTTYPDTDSTLTISTAGSLNTGRGSTYTIFHGSEVAFWSNPEEIIAGALQGMSKPNIILESTPNGASGWFYERCMESLSGKGLWKLHFYPWYMFEEYQLGGEAIILNTEETKLGLSQSQARWRRNKILELGRFFSQEYPESVEDCFLTSGNGYFSSLDLSNTFTSTNSQFVSDHVYSAGIDFGQANDFTVMVVIDRTENRMVDYIHLNKMSWNLQRLEIIKMYRKWNLNSVRAEENSIGSVNIEELQNSGLNVERFTTTNSSKSLIMQKLYEALENGLKLMDWDILKMELNNMTSKQTQSGLWTISAESGHDDTVISLALAVSAKTKMQDKHARSWRN